MMGYQFRRERPILSYVVDFVCLELLLVVEVDGATHDNHESVEQDKRRDKELESVGFTVLRFSSWEVLNRLTDVSLIISDWIKLNGSIDPSGKRTRMVPPPGPLKGDMKRDPMN